MTIPIVLRPLAQREFDDAVDWYDQRRAGLGADFIAAVHQIFDTISNNPEQHALVYGDFRKALTERFPYAVYYRLETDRAVIVAVVHTARDPAI